VDAAIAWVYTKMTEPARAVATLALVPVLVARLPARALRLFGVRPGMMSELRDSTGRGPAARAAAAAAAGAAGRKAL